MSRKEIIWFSLVELNNRSLHTGWNKSIIYVHICLCCKRIEPFPLCLFLLSCISHNTGLLFRRSMLFVFDDLCYGKHSKAAWLQASCSASLLLSFHHFAFSSFFPFKLFSSALQSTYCAPTFIAVFSFDKLNVLYFYIKSWFLIVTIKLGLYSDALQEESVLKLWLII